MYALNVKPQVLDLTIEIKSNKKDFRYLLMRIQMERGEMEITGLLI